MTIGGLAGVTRTFLLAEAIACCNRPVQQQALHSWPEFGEVLTHIHIPIVATGTHEVALLRQRFVLHKSLDINKIYSKIYFTF